jgi:hypothetical protein
MHQMAQGFRKLYSIIEELRVDAPNSKVRVPTAHKS